MIVGKYHHMCETLAHLNNFNYAIYKSAVYILLCIIRISIGPRNSSINSLAVNRQL